MEIGKNIQKIRSDNNLTQDDLAEKYFVTRQTISNWENGKSYPDLETLVKISDDFKISLDKLLKEDYEMVKDIASKQKDYKKVNTYKVLSKFLSIVCLGMILFPLVEFVGCKINNGSFVYTFNYAFYPFICGFIVLALEVLPIKKLIKKIGFICVLIVMIILSFTTYAWKQYRSEYYLPDFNINGEIEITNVETLNGRSFADNYVLAAYIAEDEINYTLIIKDYRNVSRIITIKDVSGSVYKLQYKVGKDGKSTIELLEE